MIGTIIKTGAGLVVSMGVEEIITNAVKIVTPTNMNRAKKICVTVGKGALVLMFSDMTVNYLEHRAEEIIGMFVNTKKDIEEDLENIEEIVEEA